MWCSRQNGKIMFYVGVMLLLVGLGLVLMKERLIGASVMCVGLFPLVIGFVIIVFHLKIDTTMGKKRKTIPEKQPASSDSDVPSEVPSGDGKD